MSQTLDEIIHRVTRNLLNEFHHAYDEGLMEAARQIVQDFLFMYKNECIGLEYPSRAINPFTKARNFFLKIVEANSADYAALDLDHWVMYLSKKAIETDDIPHITSLIYHELGHMTNLYKGGRGETNKDFETPSLFSIDEETYKYISKNLYRFQSREMKARCFETTMYLKEQPKDRKVMLKDVYSNRCSGIEEMNRFLLFLMTISREGEDGKNAKVIEGIFWQMNFKKIGRTRLPQNWQFMCKTVMNHFKSHYKWMKTRVDKIYTDYAKGLGHFEVKDIVGKR